jgi:gas vesicle protein GvpN
VTTVLQARPRQFVSTPTVERLAKRALRYLQSGYSIHLRGPAGTGKTTLAMHLADMLSRPIMLLFGDDEYKTSDLIGNQSGYTRKKVVDNFIHSVVKMEDELRQNWVDSRLTLACREGFTLVYDEFNRSRPEVNNVLLSALEEKLIVLPPSGNRPEYIRVNPHFRGIFTSNPEEYCGVHGTQDALMDRLITIDMPEPDELTQQEILAQKTGIDRAAGLAIVRLVKAFQQEVSQERSSSLRASMMIAKICQEHDIAVVPEDVDFRDTCGDILLSRASASLEEARQHLWNLFNGMIVSDLIVPGADLAEEIQDLAGLHPESLSSDGDSAADAADLTDEAAEAVIDPAIYSDLDANVDANADASLSTTETAAENPAAENLMDAAPKNLSENLSEELAADSPTNSTGADRLEYEVETDRSSESEPEVSLSDATANFLAPNRPAQAENFPAIAEPTDALSNQNPDAMPSSTDVDTPVDPNHQEESAIATPISPTSSGANSAADPTEHSAEHSTKTPSQLVNSAGIPVSDANAVAVYQRLKSGPARLFELEAALGLTRFQAVNALKSLAELGMITQDGGQGKPSVFKLRAV